MPGGDPPRGTPCHHRDPGGLLRGTAHCERCVPGGPPGALRGSPSLWLIDDAMQEGEQQGRRTKYLLPGTHIPSTQRRRFPLSFGRERW